MATIIAGRFDQQTDSTHTIDALLDAGFRREQIASFFLNPAGQHATYEFGGDHDRSAGARTSGKGIATGVVAGAAAGMAATPILGPLGPIAGGLLGAHLGGLIGGLSQMRDQGDIGPNAEDPENALPLRHAGMYVAIAVDDDENEEHAVNMLTSLGAIDLERAEGTINDGDWLDFDPSSPPTQCRITSRRPEPGAATPRP